MGNRRRVCRIALLTCAVALAGGLTGGCASSEASREDAETPGNKQSQNSGKVGGPMPSVLVRQFADGGKIDLGSLKGKVVLVDIWAS